MAPVRQVSSKQARPAHGRCRIDISGMSRRYLEELEAKWQVLSVKEPSLRKFMLLLGRTGRCWPVWYSSQGKRGH